MNKQLQHTPAHAICLMEENYKLYLHSETHNIINFFNNFAGIDIVINVAGCLIRGRRRWSVTYTSHEDYIVPTRLWSTDFLACIIIELTPPFALGQHNGPPNS